MPGNHSKVIEYLTRFSGLIEPGRTILDAGCRDGVPVDQYLVRQGYAVNGIDASAQTIDRARRNVPEGFFEVKDVLELGEGEYCVDGVVSLYALPRIPREEYERLLRLFASFMPNGGGVLLALGSNKPEPAAVDVDGTSTTQGHDPAQSNTELVENAGFRIIRTGFDGAGSEKCEIILARS